MMKRTLLLFVFSMVALLTFGQKRPNIIFILTDDLGYGDIGVFYQNLRKSQNIRNHPFTQTPNLDKLANGGAMLMQHYAAAPVCAPSRASLFLGQNQGHANVRDNQFDKALENNYTMPGVLKKLGYQTALFGKWGLQGVGKDTSSWISHPLKRGFDYFYGYMRHADGHEHYPKEGIYRGKKEVWHNYNEVSKQLDKCYTADLWTASAKRWIIDKSKTNASQPFFAFISFDTPHAVLELPTQAYPKGKGLNGGLQWIGKAGKMINTATNLPDSYYHPDYANATYDDDQDPVTPEIQWPDVYKRYATSVRRIDDAVGDLMQVLKDLKIEENTLVVFTSDNGPSIESYLSTPFKANFFGSFGPFDGIKRDCWEGGLRMPAIAYWKGHIAANKKIKAANAAYDWLPTFLDASGVKPPLSVDGVSILPSLIGKGKPAKSSVYVEYFVEGKSPNYDEFAIDHRKRIRNQMQVIRSGKYVGVRYDIKNQQDDFEIYDVVKDPGQRKNLATVMPDLQTHMKNEVLQSRRVNSDAIRPYDNEFVPSITKSVKPGIIWSAEKPKFGWLTLPSLGSIKKSSPDFRTINKELLGEGTVTITGYIDVPKDGEYTFYSPSDQASFLRIHHIGVIDAAYITGKDNQGKVKLKAGLHPFTFSYAHSKKEVLLEWSADYFAREAIPAKALFQ
ncbi:sulfatase-like hydrolase/transferase [Pedobacter sp. Du54]|uniref:sulfatase-like hydrolase/transferase n=1 Tax=Pedobacter anseongensis TaxID=3133439 RepID=UPI00309CA03D